MQAGPTEGRLERGPLSAVSGGAASLIRERWGRGPARSRAHWSGPDALAVLFDDAYTPAERTLRESGMAANVLAGRRGLFAVTETELREVVEQATGRSVRACLFDVRLDPDVSVLVFVLDPDDG